MRFVVDAWCSSYRDSYSAGMIQVGDWYSIMIPQIEKMIARPGVKVTLACIADEAPPADIAGFIVADTEDETPLVYYVFVKTHYRRGRRIGMPMGVAEQLLRSAGVDPEKPFNYACQTLVALRIGFKIPLAKWLPLLARFPKDERTRR
jgi:hypothetical protein